MEQRIVSSSRAPRDEAEVSLRPRRLQDFVGQRR